jgi:pyridoxamine 5'-phosphate oxidase-like protein
MEHSNKIRRMAEYDRLPRQLERILSGKGFRERKRLALPFLTVDPEGFPRAALLTLSEVRALSPTQLTVAVQSGSHTAANLIRRQKAALCFLARDCAAWIQATAGHGRGCDADPERQIFPLAVYRVKLDRGTAGEEEVGLLAGPTYSCPDGREDFSEQLFAELARTADA